MGGWVGELMEKKQAVRVGGWVGGWVSYLDLHVRSLPSTLSLRLFGH